MSDVEAIPPEIQAGVEANAMFDAIRARGLCYGSSLRNHDSGRWAGILAETCPKPDEFATPVTRPPALEG